MDEPNRRPILITGFEDDDARSLAASLGALGRQAASGDPVNDEEAPLVFAAAYDDRGLRGQRAAALEDARPWCFCIRSSDRALVAQGALAREGHLALLPPEGRELKRLLAVLDEEAKERNSKGAAFRGMNRLEADFAWRSADFEISLVCRRFARFMAEAGFYSTRASEDECALGLEEAIVNSVEHGNLELDSSLRPDDPLQEDLYEAERAKRLADPAYGDRLIRMRLAMAGEEAIVTIEDEGPGFDTSLVDAEPSGLDVSGKGFWLIKRPFDLAEYSEKGNVLKLTRRRPTHPGSGDRDRHERT